MTSELRLPEQVLDREQLDELRIIIGDDGLAELAQVFDEDSRRVVAELDASAAAGDAGGLRDAAHSFKGAASSVWAVRVAALTRELEGRLRARPDAPVDAELRELVDRVGAEAVEARRALNELAADRGRV